MRSPLSAPTTRSETFPHRAPTDIGNGRLPSLFLPFSLRPSFSQGPSPILIPNSSVSLPPLWIEFSEFFPFLSDFFRLILLYLSLNQVGGWSSSIRSPSGLVFHLRQSIPGVNAAGGNACSSLESGELPSLAYISSFVF